MQKLNAILGGNSPDTGVDLEVKKQNQAQSNRNRKEQEPSNMAFIESNGLGLFLLLASLFRKNRSRMTNCCASARRKRNGKKEAGITMKDVPPHIRSKKNWMNM